MKFSVKVEGLKELDAALSEMPKATARNTMKRALVKSGQPVADLAQQLAPRFRGTLQAKITVSTRVKNTVGNAEFSAAMRAGATRQQAGSAMRSARRAASAGKAFAQAFIGPAVLPYSHMVEFGTMKMDAQPFMRPAWEAKKHQVLASLKVTLAAEIQKTAQRAARKAKRLRSKG